MRIEGGQHAVDCVFDQHGVIGLFNIVIAHVLKHPAEPIELSVDLGVRRGGRLAPAHIEDRYRAGKPANAMNVQNAKSVFRLIFFIAPCHLT